MFEQTRQHYLKQMGVTLWYSRCELPGAAVSPEFSFGANLETAGESNVHLSGSQNPDTVRSVVPKSAADILNSLSSKQEPANVSGKSSGLVSDDKENVQPVPLDDANTPQLTSLDADLRRVSASAELLVKSTQNEAPSSTTEKYSAFNEAPALINLESLDLMLWVGEKNWFLSDNDSEYPEQLKRQLLINIASALGEDVESAQVTCFRWPFFGNPRLPGNDAASMLTLLREWLGESIVSDSLMGFLMGSKVAGLLIQESLLGALGEASELNISDERDIKVITTLPLNDLLREPLNKRIVWQHISPFKIK